MGRMIPLDGDPIIHPVLPFSLLLAGMAATIAIITGLCGFLRKRPPDLSAPPAAETPEFDIPPTNAAEPSLPPTQEATASTALEAETSEEAIKELPPPPGMRALKETYSCNNFMTKSASTRKLSSTLSVSSTLNISMKHARSISVSKIREKRRSKAEDSIWTKTIILGEKCKVSTDDDDDDNGVIYNGKLNSVSPYNPRAPRSMSMSRTISLRNPDYTIPNQDLDKEKGITRNEEKDS